jgi:hypothetical protein
MMARLGGGLMACGGELDQPNSSVASWMSDGRKVRYRSDD